MQPCGKVTDMRRCTKKKKKTAIEFDSENYKHYFELIWSESKNIKVCYPFCAENKKFAQLLDLFLNKVINYLFQLKQSSEVGNQITF